MWVGISEKSGGVSKGADAPFGTQPLEQRCSVLYLTARLARKMRVSQDGHTRFIRQENGQVFVNGNEQKPCSVSISGGGYNTLLTRLYNIALALHLYYFYECCL